MKSERAGATAAMRGHVSAGGAARIVVLAAVVALAIAGLIGFALYQRSSTTGGAGGESDAGLERPIPVVAVPARTGELPVYLFAVGSVRPYNSVVVRSRVEGELIKVAFREGQDVKAGDLLAEIDPRPFEVQLALVQGEMARSKALLDNARADLERFRELLKEDSIASRQVETQESLVRQYEAAAQADQGRIDNARLQLSYTRIVAPISGRLGLRGVDAGNIVRPSDPDGIVVITQLQPVSVVFPVPESALPRVLGRIRAGQRIGVDAFDRARATKLASGRLLAVDNQVDPATGTVKLKAEFPNSDGLLLANQFLNIRLLIEPLSGVTLVPRAAVQFGPNGPFVFVVNDDRTVAIRPVKIGPADGETTSIETGIERGTLVIVDGTDLVREGSRVELIEREPPADAGPASGADPGRSAGAAPKGDDR